MRRLRVFTVALAFCALLVVSCEKNYVEYTSGEVVVLTVDYTTNRFLGGYTIPVRHAGGDFTVEADYNSPGDFGNVTIYEKESHTKLFAGDIVWMGKGERTYPKGITAPGKFERTDNRVASTRLRLFDYTAEEFHTTADADTRDMFNAWEAVNNLDIVKQAVENAPGANVYMSLYRRSVGVGDPTDWYWLVFIRG